MEKLKSDTLAYNELSNETFLRFSNTAVRVAADGKD